MKSHGEDGGSDSCCSGDDGAGAPAGESETSGQARIAELEAQLAERQSAYLRALADAQNTRRRADQEVVSARGRGVASVGNSLVPVLEQLDLILAQDLASMQATQVKSAIEMLRSSLQKTLATHGITRDEPAVGDPFDPHRHEAVMQMVATGISPGHIAMCMQAGYRMGDTQLRPAKVAVTPTES